MARIKRGVVTHRRHKRLLSKTKGFWGQRSNVFRRAKETLLRAMAYAYKGRKLRKREFRRLFTVRISAACKVRNFSYSRLIDGLNKSNILLNRKMLSQLAIFEPTIFDTICETAKKAVGV